MYCFLAHGRQLEAEFYYNLLSRGIRVTAVTLSPSHYVAKKLGGLSERTSRPAKFYAQPHAPGGLGA
jgi:hypothetical protein